MDQRNDTHLIWIDLEMTGLDPEKDRIIEIATIITDTHLDIIAEGPVMAITQSADRLDQMDDWNKSHHGQSGLIDRVLASDITESAAQAKTIEFLEQYISAGVSPMCGNSICQDRRFLVNYMPTLQRYFHYRNLDVSSLKILAQRWKPEIASGIAKVYSHVALQDIKDSIEELKYYRTYLLNVD